MYLTQLTHTALQHNVKSSKLIGKKFNSISSVTINICDQRTHLAINYDFRVRQVLTLHTQFYTGWWWFRAPILWSNQLVSKRINIALYIIPMRIKNMTIGTFDVYIETDWMYKIKFTKFCTKKAAIYSPQSLFLKKGQTLTLASLDV